MDRSPCIVEHVQGTPCDKVCPNHAGRLTMHWVSDADRETIWSCVNEHADRIPFGDAQLMVQWCLKTLNLYHGAINQTQTLSVGLMAEEGKRRMLGYILVKRVCQH